MAIKATRWLVAAALLALAGTAALGARPAAAASVHPAFATQAMWIWQLPKTEGGSLDRVIAKAKANRIGAVYVKSADAGNRWSQFTPAAVARLKAAGLRVCGWQFVYGNKPVAEAAAGAAARTAGAECLIIDAEGAYEGKYNAAASYMKELRRRVGNSYPLGFTSFPYVSFHTGLPYSVFLGSRGAQVNMPQVYWRDIGTTVTTAMTRTWRENRIYGRPIVPIGQTYQSAPVSDIARFRAFARAWDAPGYSWWEWSTTSPRQWAALANRNVSRINPGDPGWPVLARGAKGDPVRQGQRLLVASGYKDVKANGIFGNVTAASVKAFQESRRIPVTGSLDAATWPALMKVAGARITERHRAAAARRSP
ncbi:MAG: peptidoglycan-binding domain-containing protein [Solirubrobacterales bacterium]